MTTPTTYPLEYEDPCDQELDCEPLCGGKVKFMARPHEFCDNVTIDLNLKVLGNTYIDGSLTVNTPSVTVAGQTFTPTVINTISGPHLVLAVY